MRFYTKEWYTLMQGQSYTMGMRRIPDRDHSDGEIKALYQKKRKQFIARERRCYNEPPIHFAVEDFPGEGLYDGKKIIV